MALGQRRQHVRLVRLARDLGAVLLVLVEVRRLQRDLWLTGRGDRPDDVDLAVGHRDPDRGGTQRRDRASNGTRHDGRARQAARRTRRRDGGHGWGGEELKKMEARAWI